MNVLSYFRRDLVLIMSVCICMYVRMSILVLFLYWLNAVRVILVMPILLNLMRRRIIMRIDMMFIICNSRCLVLHSYCLMWNDNLRANTYCLLWNDSFRTNSFCLLWNDYFRTNSYCLLWNKQLLIYNKHIAHLSAFEWSYEFSVNQKFNQRKRCLLQNNIYLFSCNHESRPSVLDST